MIAWIEIGLNLPVKYTTQRRYLHDSVDWNEGVVYKLVEVGVAIFTIAWIEIAAADRRQIEAR